MRTLFILLVTVLTGVTSIAQEVPKSTTEVIVASLTATASDGYFFTNNVNERELKFQRIDGDVIGGYDLMDPSNIGRFFRITYRVDFVKKDAPKDETKLLKEQQPYNRRLSIIELEELPEFQEEYNDDDGDK